MIIQLSLKAVGNNKVKMLNVHKENRL